MSDDSDDQPKDIDPQTQAEQRLSEPPTPRLSLVQRSSNWLFHFSPAARAALVARTTWTYVILALSLSANVVQIWGEPWPTDPIFLAGPLSFGSSLDIPFVVRNPSALFWIRSQNSSAAFFRFTPMVD
jgi:hypothetical protein